MNALALLVALWLFPQAAPAAQEREPVTAVQLKAAIDKLGTVDYPVRMDAARTVRRGQASLAVPALIQAVDEHADGYVRFRALVLLSGFNDDRTRDVMITALASPNDRLRTVAYAYFEHNPDPQVIPRLLDALSREESEFVRPALTRALAAYGKDPRVRDVMNGLVLKGQDFFRSAVIDALGDYKAAYALANLTTVAKLEGPLQDDAVMAIGKIGDKASLATLAALQRTAPKATQPSIAAAICLLGVNCASHMNYLDETLRFAIANPGYQDLLRAAASGLGAIAAAGNADAFATLIQQGVPTRDPARSPMALAVGAVALRNTPLVLKSLEGLADQKPALLLLRDAFDMLEEDFEEERFFVTVRRGYWQAADGSPSRKLANALIQTLEF
ncbi:MAG TPA: HEAT repeat domain-containing protein [Vicinamibacterales bacterium]